MVLQKQLIDLVDEDTNAFNSIIKAFSLPKETSQEKAKERRDSKSTRNAIEVPFKIMQLSFDSLPLIKEMAKNGNPNSITDAGVAMHCAKAAINGAFLNVRINCKDLKDKEYTDNIIRKCFEILKKTKKEETLILKIVDNKLN